MAPMFYEEDLLMLVSALFSSIPSLLLSAAGYVLSALALYTIARRRGLNNPWIAWIPVANCWILGSLSDQYQYVVKGENKAKRKLLLILNILTAVVGMAIVACAGVVLVQLTFGFDPDDLLGLIIGVLGLALPLAGMSIACAVIRYMALYDLFRSLDPNNAVLFLVLSILFGVTEPFFLFFNRNKDGGMPPRRQPEPAYASIEQPRQEPWEENNKDYL